MKLNNLQDIDIYHKNEQKLILCFISSTVALLNMVTLEFKIVCNFEDFSHKDSYERKNDRMIVDFDNNQQELPRLVSLSKINSIVWHFS